MRTFPGVWVPPGGGIDPEDKSLVHTALRELQEETGLVLDMEKGVRDVHQLCMWESGKKFKNCLYIRNYYLARKGSRNRGSLKA